MRRATLYFAEALGLAAMSCATTVLALMLVTAGPAAPHPSPPSDPPAASTAGGPTPPAAP